MLTAYIYLPIYYFFFCYCNGYCLVLSILSTRRHGWCGSWPLNKRNPSSGPNYNNWTGCKTTNTTGLPKKQLRRSHQLPKTPAWRGLRPGALGEIPITTVHNISSQQSPIFAEALRNIQGRRSDQPPQEDKTSPCVTPASHSARVTRFVSRNDGKQSTRPAPAGIW